MAPVVWDAHEDQAVHLLHMGTEVGLVHSHAYSLVDSSVSESPKTFLTLLRWPWDCQGSRLGGGGGWRHLFEKPGLERSSMIAKRDFYGGEEEKIGNSGERGAQGASWKADRSSGDAPGYRLLPGPALLNLLLVGLAGLAGAGFFLLSLTEARKTAPRLLFPCQWGHGSCEGEGGRWVRKGVILWCVRISSFLGTLQESMENGIPSPSRPSFHDLV